MGRVSREVGIGSQSQKEMPAIESTVAEVRTVSDGLVGRPDAAEGRIAQLGKAAGDSPRLRSSATETESRNKRTERP